MYKKIAVGTDLSDTSKVAVAHAAALAHDLGAELVLIYAGEDPGAPLDALGKEFIAETLAVPGPPAEVLMGESERLGVDLLVVGSVGMSGARRFAIGNVPNKVSHHANRDLLIVKTDKPSTRDGHYRKILVGADGSQTAMRAVEMASQMANSLGVVPTVVTVYESPTEHELDQLRHGADDVIGAWHATREQRETPTKYQWKIAGAAQAEDILERAGVRASKFGVEAELRAVEGGSPAEELLRIAEDENFDLICVGGVGMSGAARYMLGNVPHRLSHHAPTDILILQTAP